MNKAQKKTLPLTVAIPTYGREQVLIDTINQFLRQEPATEEILVVDQTLDHLPETEQRLKSLHEDGAIQWIRLLEPSQPGALNRALAEATQPIVLFLDDDIEIVPGFVQAHFQHYKDEQVWAVAGQILQPDQEELNGWIHKTSNSPFADFDFPFHSDTRTWIQNGMSGNLSVRREKAIEIGGFDENFVPPVSYRFDNEFCKRICNNGGKILFEPSARIYHLRHNRGGTRTYGTHLTSPSLIHGAGDYYFALRQGINMQSIIYILRRPFREVSTRFHLKHPWWIPVKLFGEIRALLLAIKLYKQGPRLIQKAGDPG